jgi:hypothetical protein
LPSCRCRKNHAGGFVCANQRSRPTPPASSILVCQTLASLVSEHHSSAITRSKTGIVTRYHSALAASQTARAAATSCRVANLKSFFAACHR